MNKPEILGANIAGCAATGPGAVVWVPAAWALRTGGMVAVAAVCNAPVVGLVLAGGYAA